MIKVENTVLYIDVCSISKSVHNHLHHKHIYSINIKNRLKNTRTMSYVLRSLKLPNFTRTLE